MAKIAPEECFPRMYAAELPAFYLISANEGKRSLQKTGSWAISESNFNHQRRAVITSKMYLSKWQCRDAYIWH